MGERASGSRRGKRLTSSSSLQLNRRLALRSIGALAGLTAMSGSSVLLGGCGGGGGDSAPAGGNSPLPAAPPQAISPSLGVHNLGFGPGGGGIDPTTVHLNTPTSSGSTILVGVGRGQINQHVAPTDNMNNTYAGLEAPHVYGTLWAISGTALYVSSSATAGVNEISTTNPNSDEITVAVVEILNGGMIEDHSWIYADIALASQTSAPVSTNGPATLVAFWWGDANANNQTAVPRAGSGFTLLDSLLGDPSGQFVQCAVAVKNVSAGQHTVTWDATPDQGAQLHLVAVRNAN